MISMCRICMVTETVWFYNVFSESPPWESSYNLATLVMQCAPIQIYPDDGLPVYLCRVCMDTLKTVYQFQKLCITTDTKLRQSLKMIIKSETNNESEESNLGETEFDILANSEYKHETDTKVDVTNNVLCNNKPQLQSLDSDNSSDNEPLQNLILKYNSSFPNECLKTTEEKEQSCTEESLEIYKNNSYTEIKSMIKPTQRGRKKKGTCKYCDKMFSNLLGLKVHQKIHEGDKPFVCVICKKGFRHNKALTEHKLSHTDERPYACEYCDKTYKSRKSLRTHRRSHTGERPYICDLCGKSFTNNTSLKSHKIVHSGIRAYICEICGKSYTTKGNLIGHKRSHTGERPYKCNVCEKTFASAPSFNCHKKTHATERLYKCEVCGKSYLTHGDLKKHLKYHSDTRPYSCLLCEKSFKTSSNLATHRKIHNIVST